MCRGLLLCPQDQFYSNHEGNSYQMRLMEFRDVLASGNLSPQWCSHNARRAGLSVLRVLSTRLVLFGNLVPWMIRSPKRSASLLLARARGY